MEQRMTMHPEDFDFPLTVRYGEIGFDGVATLPSLANWLQEAAGQENSSASAPGPLRSIASDIAAMKSMMPESI